MTHAERQVYIEQLRAELPPIFTAEHTWDEIAGEINDRGIKSPNGICWDGRRLAVFVYHHHVLPVGKKARAGARNIAALKAIVRQYFESTAGVMLDVFRTHRKWRERADELNSRGVRTPRGHLWDEVSLRRYCKKYRQQLEEVEHERV